MVAKSSYLLFPLPSDVIFYNPEFQFKHIPGVKYRRPGVALEKSSNPKILDLGNGKTVKKFWNTAERRNTSAFCNRKEFIDIETDISKQLLSPRILSVHKIRSSFDSPISETIVRQVNLQFSAKSSSKNQKHFHTLHPESKNRPRTLQKFYTETDILLRNKSQLSKFSTLSNLSNYRDQKYLDPEVRKFINHHRQNQNQLLQVITDKQGGRGRLVGGKGSSEGGICGKRDGNRRVKLFDLFKGQRFKTTEGQHAAATLIQSLWRMHVKRSAYLHYR